MFKQIEIFEDHLVAHHPNGKRLELYPEGATVMSPVLDAKGRNVMKAGRPELIESPMLEKHNRKLIPVEQYQALRGAFDTVTKIAEDSQWMA